MEPSGQYQQQHAPHDSGHIVDSKELQHEVQALREKDVDAGESNPQDQHYEAHPIDRFPVTIRSSQQSYPRLTIHPQPSN